MITSPLEYDDELDNILSKTNEEDVTSHNIVTPYSMHDTEESHKLRQITTMRKQKNTLIMNEDLKE